MEKTNNNKDTYDDIIERIAERVVNMRLGTVAIVLLESTKPLSFIASQVLVFFEPIVRALFNPKDYKRFYEMLEDRNNIEKLIQRIEEKENEK